MYNRDQKSTKKEKYNGGRRERERVSDSWIDQSERGANPTVYNLAVKTVMPQLGKSNYYFLESPDLILSYVQMVSSLPYLSPIFFWFF